MEPSAMQAPYVSVIVPAFNAARHIERALDSVAAQSEARHEVLVCDDASSDDTARIVADRMALDPRIRLVRLDSNGGASAARNRGLALASGRWIAILDADDAFHPERLERLTALGESLGADIVADNLVMVESGSGRALRTAMPTGTGAAPRRLQAEQLVDKSLFLRREFKLGYLKPIFRRSFLEAARIVYHEDLRIAEDYHLYLDCLLAGADFRVSEDPLYLYTLTAGSLSRSLARADLEQLALRSARSLEHPAVAASPALEASLRRRHQSILDNIRFMDIVALAKTRRIGAAIRLATLPRPMLRPIVTQGSEAIWKRVRRLAPRHGGAA